MSDEFYKCGVCGSEEPDTTTKIKLEFRDDEQKELAEEILDIEIDESTYVFSEDLDLLDDKEVIYDYEEITVCCECGQEYEPVCFARRD